MLMRFNLRNGLNALLLILLAFLFFLSAEPGQTVYVTNSGTRYHLDGCTSLRSSQIAVSLLDAVRSGYIVCNICRPPVLNAVPQDFVFGDDTQSSAWALYRVNTAGLANSASADTGRMLRAEVVGHIDGDTVRVRITNPPPGLRVIETIRFIGVDTPETVHPNRQAEYFGQQASEFTRSHLFGKNVFLAFDWDLRDRYGRLLAYIYTEQGRCFNAQLIQEGYGHAYLRFPFKFMDEFQSLEQEARWRQLGLWRQ